MSEITQADRDAAAALHLANVGEPHSPHDMRERDEILTGENDDWDSVQAFAAHRIAAYAAGLAAGIAQERERWAVTDDTINKVAGEFVERPEHIKAIYTAIIATAIRSGT